MNQMIPVQKKRRKSIVNARQYHMSIGLWTYDQINKYMSMDVMERAGICSNIEESILEKDPRPYKSDAIWIMIAIIIASFLNWQAKWRLERGYIYMRNGVSTTG